MRDEIRNRHGERLDYTFHPGNGTQETLAVIGHGVTGNKDRPFAQATAETLAGLGLDALRFSFSGNGDSEGRFVDSTISKEIEDLGSVLDAVGDRPILYVGHSMGGAVGVSRASSDSRIRYLISLAGMVDTATFADRKFGELTPGQDVMWEKPECPLSQTYWDDMHAIGSVLPRAKSIEIPWLLVHGDDDTVVPLEDSESLVRELAKPPKLVTLQGADHVFTGEAMAAMTDAVATWVKNVLHGDPQ